MPHCGDKTRSLDTGARWIRRSAPNALPHLRLAESSRGPLQAHSQLAARLWTGGWPVSWWPVKYQPQILWPLIAESTEAERGLHVPAYLNAMQLCLRCMHLLEPKMLSNDEHACLLTLQPSWPMYKIVPSLMGRSWGRHPGLSTLHHYAV